MNTHYARSRNYYIYIVYLLKSIKIIGIWTASENMAVGFNLTKVVGAMKIESLEDYNGTIFETGALKLI